jgi:hypothetical protein
MDTWIRKYVEGCATCQQNKNLPKKATPEYRIPVPVTAVPFEVIAMDLITQLPPSNGYDAILTIVDHGCTRAALFLPCKTTITGAEIASLYFDNVYRWFGLPKRIISDRDPRFTSSFATELVKAIQATRNLSTAYHPQTDGLTERKNQWIEQYLRLFAADTQDDWDKWLTIATVVHNSWPNATTKVAPSQAMLGYLPDLTGTKIQTTNETISQRQEQAEQWRTKAKDALNLAANQIPAEQYTVGDQVWLENKNLTLTHGTRKLHPRRHGPFQITKQISPVAYKLQLPASWTIHDVFHASLLRPYKETEQKGANYTRPPPDIVQGESEYEVEAIINHRHHGRKQDLQYLLKWKGYPDADNTWEPADQVHAPMLIKHYHKKHPLIRTKTDKRRASEPLNGIPTSSHLPQTNLLLPQPPPPTTDRNGQPTHPRRRHRQHRPRYSGCGRRSPRHPRHRHRHRQRQHGGSRSMLASPETNVTIDNDEQGVRMADPGNVARGEAELTKSPESSTRTPTATTSPNSSKPRSPTPSPLAPQQWCSRPPDQATARYYWTTPKTSPPPSASFTNDSARTSLEPTRPRPEPSRLNAASKNSRPTKRTNPREAAAAVAAAAAAATTATTPPCWSAPKGSKRTTGRSPGSTSPTTTGPRSSRNSSGSYKGSGLLTPRGHKDGGSPSTALTSSPPLTTPTPTSPRTDADLVHRRPLPTQPHVQHGPLGLPRAQQLGDQRGHHPLSKLRRTDRDLGSQSRRSRPMSGTRTRRTHLRPVSSRSGARPPPLLTPGPRTPR